MDPEYYVYLYEKHYQSEEDENIPFDPFHYLYEKDDFEEWLMQYREQVELGLTEEDFSEDELF